MAQSDAVAAAVMSVGEGVALPQGEGMGLALGTALGDMLYAGLRLAVGELVSDWQPVHRKREASKRIRM